MSSGCTIWNIFTLCQSLLYFLPFQKNTFLWEYTSANCTFFQILALCAMGKRRHTALLCPASKKSDRIYGSFGKCCACRTTAVLYGMSPLGCWCSGVVLEEHQYCSSNLLLPCFGDYFSRCQDLLLRFGEKMTFLLL